MRPDLRMRLGPNNSLAFVSQLPSCVITMEASGDARYWSCQIGKLCPEVRLIPRTRIMTFAKRQQNNAANAEVTCGAAVCSTMSFVPVKIWATQGKALVFQGRALLLLWRSQ